MPKRGILVRERKKRSSRRSKFIDVPLVNLGPSVIADLGRNTVTKCIRVLLVRNRERFLSLYFLVKLVYIVYGAIEDAFELLRII